jgi:MurNAc alpha-1-phosphate uridylyltransferase
MQPSHPFPVAILAGGMATRLRPITETIPKALVEVAGQPFVIRQLRYLRTQGIARVVLCVGHLGDQIEAVVGGGADFGLQITYSFDGPKLLGTGGALRQALPLLGGHFFVLYGDSFLPVDFGLIQQAFVASGRAGLMTVLRNRDRWDKSNVLFLNGQLVEYNKYAPRPDMEYIDYGLGILTENTLKDYLSDQVIDLADVYHRLSSGGQLAGYEVFTRFYEIGSLAGLREAEDYFSNEGQA